MKQNSNQSKHMAHVAILGEGAWGTAVAQLLARNGHQVTLWCHDPHVAQEITQAHINSRYLPDVPLHKNIASTTDIKAALQTSKYIFEATPVQFLRPVLQDAAPFATKQHCWILLSKGIEQKTLNFPTQILSSVLGPLVTADQIAVLAGPSYAHDVAQNQPTMVMLASSNQELRLQLQALVQNDHFIAQLSDDIRGTQACAAYKNVAALGIGMLEGAGYGNNTKIVAFMRALDEMRTLVALVGGKQETVASCAGIGDLTLTTLLGESRNRKVGVALGQGKKLQDILATGVTVEGAHTVVSLQQLAAQAKKELPLCATIYKIVYEQAPVQILIDAIMSIQAIV